MRIEFDFIAVLLQWPLLAKGVLWTLGLTAISAVIGLLLGTACAWARARNLGHRPAALRWRAVWPSRFGVCAPLAPILGWRNFLR